MIALPTELDFSSRYPTLQSCLIATELEAPISTFLLYRRSETTKTDERTILPRSQLREPSHAGDLRYIDRHLRDEHIQGKEGRRKSSRGKRSLIPNFWWLKVGGGTRKRFFAWVIVAGLRNTKCMWWFQVPDNTISSKGLGKTVQKEYSQTAGWNNWSPFSRLEFLLDWLLSRNLRVGFGLLDEAVSPVYTYTLFLSLLYRTLCFIPNDCIDPDGYRQLLISLLQLLNWGNFIHKVSPSRTPFSFTTSPLEMRQHLSFPIPKL